ncbi:MAG TPA: Flp family type IVb pilin [Candidatus Binataceae bacterium]|nr:Flp family type IVb pilin [Candidatus Binataceae bacterium]
MLFRKFVNRLRKQAGQGMAEYGLILALVSVVAIATLTNVGSDLKTLFSTVATDIAG